MKVLEHEHDRPALPETTEESEDALEGPRLPALGRGLAAFVDRCTDRRESCAELGQEPDDLGRRRAEQPGQRVVGQRDESRADGSDDRTVWLVRVGGPGRRPQDGHRLPESLDPGDRLVEEPADTDAGRALEQERRRPSVGGVVEASRELDERRFAPHEPRARVPDGHGSF